ncbi:MAG: hypothetical protein OEU26_26325 [Candidatus Tectomicrobia bacterium]|nr:hypothetical protein [Candidatus Tectomicrobia bacterium]
MSVPRYLYTHNREAGSLLIGLDDEPYQFQTDDGNSQPLSLDDVICLDTAEAAFLAEADALLGAWRDLCQSVVDVPDPDAARQTLRECLEVITMAIHDESGKDPDPALALEPAAGLSFKAA